MNYESQITHKDFRRAIFEDEYSKEYLDSLK